MVLFFASVSSLQGAQDYTVMLVTSTVACEEGGTPYKDQLKTLTPDHDRCKCVTQFLPREMLNLHGEAK